MKEIEVDLGGKANSLKILKEHSLPIPDFFVIPSNIYKKVLEENNIINNIKDYYQKKKFKEIRKEITNAKISKEIEQYIYEEFSKLNTLVVAVRSSAKNEDGNKKSFAGQYSSFLNIKKENLLSTIKKCWCSLYDKNVISYQNNHNEDIFDMNVIVQKMINPSYSGVAFSINPISISKNYSCIETCRGTAENLVSGKITPSTYLIRRQTKQVDFQEGEDLLNKEIITKLETYILKIEEIYKSPVDVEWCYKDDIYILQARTITAFTPKKEPIKNMITRQKKLWQIELYCKGEYFGIKSLTTDLYYQNPILYFISSQKTEVYYNMSSLEENPELIFRALDDNYNDFSQKINKASTICEEILKLIKEEDLDFRKIVNNLIYIQPFNTIANIGGRNWHITERVKEKLYTYRKKYDYVLYEALDAADAFLERTLPTNLQKYISVLSLEDITNIDNINIDALEEKLKGFIYYQGKMYEPNLDKFCQKNNLYVEDYETNTSGIVHGTTAYPGKCKGIVKIIYSKDDIKKFNKKDIIVSPMTTPKFTSIMKEASGIITDEGGVTCHAAIVARELKKPCLIGCKNATKILKDGMEVELDSTNGIVTIISK